MEQHKEAKHLKIALIGLSVVYALKFIMDIL